LRNITGVVKPEQLLALILDPLFAAAGTLQATAGFSLLADQLVSDGRSNLLRILGTDTKAAVEGGNALLDLLDPDGSTLTVVGLRLALDAVEVGVGAAVALVLRVDLAAATGGAVHGGT